MPVPHERRSLSYLSLLLLPGGVEEPLPLPLLLLLHVLVLVQGRPELVRVGGRHLQKQVLNSSESFNPSTSQNAQSTQSHICRAHMSKMKDESIAVDLGAVLPHLEPRIGRQPRPSRVRYTD